MAAKQRPVSALVVIVEQPASRKLRFRYPTDARGRSAGSLPGVNSTSEQKTFPAIQIIGYTGPANVLVSCVTKDKPYRPHSHNLVGRECKKGIFFKDMTVTEENNTCQLTNLGIQCVKRTDIPKALELRKELRIDPFRTGFDHAQDPQSIDLNAVRLAFQVLIPDNNGNMHCPLRPVCSDVIYDKMNLRIMKLSHCSGTAKGGTEIILLCDKVCQADTAVIFQEMQQGRVVWEQVAPTMRCHKQVSIIFTTPPYRDQSITEPVEVFLKLKRISDDERSEPATFEYIPDDQVYIHKRLMKPIVSFQHQCDDDAPGYKRCKSSLDDGGPAHQVQNWAPVDSSVDSALPGPSRSEYQRLELDMMSPDNNEILEQVSPTFKKLSIREQLVPHIGKYRNEHNNPLNMRQVSSNPAHTQPGVDQTMQSSLNMRQVSSSPACTQPGMGQTIHNSQSSLNKRQVSSSPAHMQPGMDQTMHNSQSSLNMRQASSSPAYTQCGMDQTMHNSQSFSDIGQVSSSPAHMQPGMDQTMHNSQSSLNMRQASSSPAYTQCGIDQTMHNSQSFSDIGQVSSSPAHMQPGMDQTMHNSQSSLNKRQVSSSPAHMQPGIDHTMHNSQSSLNMRQVSSSPAHMQPGMDQTMHNLQSSLNMRQVSSSSTYTQCGMEQTMHNLQSFSDIGQVSSSSAHTQPGIDTIICNTQESHMHQASFNSMHDMDQGSSDMNHVEQYWLPNNSQQVYMDEQNAVSEYNLDDSVFDQLLQSEAMKIVLSMQPEDFDMDSDNLSNNCDHS